MTSGASSGSNRPLVQSGRWPCYPSLTTQLYFQGDEFLDADVARAVKDDLILRLESAGSNGASHLTLRYDFRLAPAGH